MSRQVSASQLALACWLLASSCASELPRRSPPLAGMDEPLERIAPPDDEAARQALPKGSFTGASVGDARQSLDAMLGEPEGVVVQAVVENSPADAAGIEVGDLILEVLREPPIALHWPSEWRRLELETEPGAKLRLVIDRAGAEREVELVPVARVRSAEHEAGQRVREEERVGIVLRTATEVEARAAALGPGGGAVVVGLTRESPWREAGVAFGDLIRAVDGVEVAHPAVVVDAILSGPEDGELELEIVREQALVTLRAPLSRREQQVTEISLPPLFSYEKERDASTTSFLLGFVKYESTPAAWRLRLVWLFAFAGGDADRLEIVER